jgi:hypothetical protein
MKIRIVVFSSVLGCTALCLALPAVGQIGQTTITLTGVNGSTSSDNGGSLLNGEDVYTGLYYATVDGKPGTGVICDDFNHDDTIGETWTANAINTWSLNSTNILKTEFGATIGFVGYAEVATLASEIFALNNGTAASFGGVSKVTGTDLGEAIWDITTPGGITGITNNAKALVKWVEGLYGSSSAALAYLHGQSLWILTPNPNNGPQELWAVSVPEGGSALQFLLLAGLMCFGAMRFRSKRQYGNRMA